MGANSLKKDTNPPENLVYKKDWVLDQWGKYWCFPINDVGIVSSYLERKKAGSLPHSIKIDTYFLYLCMHTSSWYKPYTVNSGYFQAD